MSEKQEQLKLENQMTPKAKADLLIGKMLKGKTVADMFETNFRSQWTLSGQPISHWEKRFKIKIPSDNLTPQICKELDAKLIELNQEAAFFHAVAQAKSQFLKRGSEANYYSRFYTIVEDFKSKGARVPAASTLEVLARINNEELDAAAEYANVETKFWKNILDDLATCRRLVENASLNISVEMKAEANTAMLDRLNNQNNGR